MNDVFNGQAPRRSGPRSRIVRCVSIGAVAAAVASCRAAPPDSTVPEYELVPPRILVSQESALLAQPRDLTLDSAGNLYILDQMDRRVVVVAPDGHVRHTIGRPGGGPGEFGLPFAIGMDAEDRLRVFDHQKRSVQVLSSDGEHLDEYQADLLGVPTRIAFGADGRLAYFGLRVAERGGLAAILDGSGRESLVLGDLITDDLLIPPNLLEVLHRRRLPEFMRNTVLPAFAPDGGVWLFLQTEAILLRFGPDGTPIGQTPVSVPEMRDIEEDYFDWYAEIQTEGLLRFFEYAEDADVVDGSLWILWYTPDDRPGLITVHDPTGRVAARLVLRGVAMDTVTVDERAGARRRRFTVDPNRLQLYLTDPWTSTVKAFPVPAELLRN